MTRLRLSLLGLIVALSISSVPARAFSSTSLQGSVFGLELCQETVCGSAIFIGTFVGRVDSRPAFGAITVSVTHGLPLPVNDGDHVPIFGGTWAIQLLSGRRITGAITPGLLTSNGDNTFQIAVGMAIQGGGAAAFGGTLSHTTFPPTIGGLIVPQ